jgi:hypothetical protein
VPVFGSSGFWRFATLRLKQVFYAPPPRHSPIASFLSDVSARLHPSLLRLIILLFVLCFLWFPCILFPLYYFCFYFPLYFVFARFPCIASLCLFCVFFCFYSSVDLFRACFAALRPLPGLFPRPTLSSFQCVLQCTGSACTQSVLFSCIFIV